MRRFLVLILITTLAALAAQARGADEQDDSPTVVENGTANSAVTAGPSEDDVSQSDRDDDGPPLPEPSEDEIDPRVTEALTAMGMVTFEKPFDIADFTLRDLSGESHTLSNYSGSVVFLNFWATWCPPCREEMPSMQSLYERYGDDGLVMLAVNLLESEPEASDFVEHFGYTFPVLLDLDGRAGTTYAVRAIPTTYIINRRGQIIGMRPGYHNWEDPTVIDAFDTLLSAEYE